MPEHRQLSATGQPLLAQPLHASQGQQPGTLPAHRVCSLRQPLLAPPLHASLVVLQDELSDEVSEGEVETEEGDNVGET